MRAVVQRVQEATVTINRKIFSKINQGLLVFVGIEDLDNAQDLEWLAGKICRLRIFNDCEGIMNLSVKEAEGEILVISQFTLHASTKKGNRPSYFKASKPEIAIPMYKKFVQTISLEMGSNIKTGKFGEDMKIHLINDGPVTIIIDTKNRE
jgi:D-aminoacyl-tRNA deacylase